MGGFCGAESLDHLLGTFRTRTWRHDGLDPRRELSPVNRRFLSMILDLGPSSDTQERGEMVDGA